MSRSIEITDGFEFTGGSVPKLLFAERTKAMSYPKLVRISEYQPLKREFVDKWVKVYSAGDESMIRIWHDDMNRKLQSQQRRDDCAAGAAK